MLVKNPVWHSASLRSLMAHAGRGQVVGTTDNGRTRNIPRHVVAKHSPRQLLLDTEEREDTVHTHAGECHRRNQCKNAEAADNILNDLGTLVQQFSQSSGVQGLGVSDSQGDSASKGGRDP